MAQTIRKTAPKEAGVKAKRVLRLADVKRAKESNGPQEFASVFDAIADTPDEAASMKARAALARQVTRAFKEYGWTQAEAAKRCHVTQPRISDLINGRISKFSLDALVNIASALGEVSVELELQPA